jgi:3-oxoacyl-(acyl-carrier-protein) synthase
MAIAWIPSAPVGQLSIFHQITGYTRTFLNDGAAGLDAIGNSWRAIQRGEADVIISGGFEAIIAEASMATMSTFVDLCKDAPDPAVAYRPFDVDRNGTVLAEGGWNGRKLVGRGSTGKLLPTRNQMMHMTIVSSIWQARSMPERCRRL